VAVDRSIAKRFALDPSDHGLLDQSKDTLHTRIARYVGVRRERGEQMKVIVPDAAKRFRVSKTTVRAVSSPWSRRGVEGPKGARG
jgi:hypothetical protein